jgi:light-dependent protochlorophyllide reductase
MTGRVIIVSGASAGLGYEVARYLCEGGNDVILACRSEEKANRAIEKIKRSNPNALATFMQLDLANLESVRKFVDDFHASGKKLHVLVNNAGVYMNPRDPKRQYTTDNFEMTMGTNHLGPFLLTNLLLDDLKATGGDGGNSRIVNVTSNFHDPSQASRRNNLQPLDFENFFLFNEGTYNGMQAYKNSKLANIMFTYELARRLEGTGVTANCVFPGSIPSTDLIRNVSGAKKFFYRYVIHGALRFTKQTRTVQQGAAVICNVATDDKYKETTGKYFIEYAEAKSSEESLNEENQKKLWDLSGGYVHLEGYEPIEVPPPPVEEEKPKEEEKKEGEASKEGEKTEDQNKTDDDKKDDTKEEEKEEKKEEEKEEKKVEEETKDEKEEKPAESENKEEEKKE